MFMAKTSKALGVVVVFALAAGTAWASIPDSGGAIHGCYKTDNGKLRVIDSSSAGCQADESSLSWNQTGPTGPPGRHPHRWAAHLARAPRLRRDA